jgi:hypothetical protein
MADFSSIVEHPDSQEIIDKLLSGTSPRDISRWLKLKYTKKNQSHLRLTIKLLKAFSESDYTDCYAQFKKDLAVVKNPDQQLTTKQVKNSLLNNKTYKERLEGIAEQELDIKKMLQSLIVTCHDRAEQVFDSIQQNPHKFHGDNYLLRYLNELFNAAEKYEKIINNAPDQVIQHNITLQAVQTNVDAILEAIRKTLAKLDTETSLLFMELFHNELKNLEDPVGEEMSQEERLKEAKLLEHKISNHNKPGLS